MCNKPAKCPLRHENGLRKAHRASCVFFIQTTLPVHLFLLCLLLVAAGCGEQKQAAMPANEIARVGAGSVVLDDVPPNSTVVGVPAHIVYRAGQRVLITDPHEIKDPLSDALIALSARVRELEKCLCIVDNEVQIPEPFAAEAAEREAYREELDRLQEYVSMGEGI